MSDLAVLAATIKAALQEVAKQAAGLRTGLQNAAPGDKAGKPNNSVEYLLNISDALEKAAKQCEEKFLDIQTRDNKKSL